MSEDQQQPVPYQQPQEDRPSNLGVYASAAAGGATAGILGLAAQWWWNKPKDGKKEE